MNAVGGTLLWITSSKTDAGKRKLDIPSSLRPYLLDMAEGRSGSELLFGHHWPEWVRAWVRRICKVAKVPIVCAQSMRGLHASMAVESGATGELVAKALGHADAGVTMRRHYARASAIEGAQQRRALVVLSGGK